MIVQCEACQTRFRLADEKVKPGGIRVRCSKCKEVFTVTPPKPEPVEEAVDFGSFNMEKVTEGVPGEAAPTPESPRTDASESWAQSAPPPAPEPDSTPESAEPPKSSDLDFSALETEMASDAGPDEELADDFTFAGTSQPMENDIAGDDTTLSDTGFSIDEEPQEEQTGEQQTNFGSAFEETEEPGGPLEFDFSEDAESASESFKSTETDFATAESTEPSEFSFDQKESPAQDAPGEISFGDEGDDSAFSFDDAEDETSPAANEEDREQGEVTLDDESPFGEESASGWDDDFSGDDTSFDFEEPQFEHNDSPAESSASSPEEGGLQFGEIDFASDDEESETPGFQTDDDFSQVTMEPKDEPEPLSPSQPSTPSPSRAYDEEKPLRPPPPPPKKSSLSRILVLLVLLLVILGGAAGFLFMQEGALNLNTIVRYLPFLQDYIGEAPASAPGDHIDINIAGSSYVNGQAGQMLIIQGAAVNNHPTTRSAITVKGVLLDAKGQSLLQQTVFCGNQLDDAALQSMTFAAIEEAMNNQFGDSLSNMNVAAGASISFTIVFRNLPAGIASINVEVVDSNPGGG